MVEALAKAKVDEGDCALPPAKLMFSGTSPEFCELAGRFGRRFFGSAAVILCSIDQALEGVSDARDQFAIIDWPQHRRAARLDLIMRQRSVRGGVIAVTGSTDVNDVVGALDHGVDDCVGYEIDVRELAARLRATWHKLHDAAATVPPSHGELRLRRSLASETSFMQRLSPRERQVLEALAAGIDPKQIGDRVGCNYSTIRTHIRRLCTKLGCSGLREAIVKFHLELGPLQRHEL